MAFIGLTTGIITLQKKQCWSNNKFKFVGTVVTEERKGIKTTN